MNGKNISSNQTTGTIKGHTKVNSEEQFQVDTAFNTDGTYYLRETPGANIYDYQGENLTWNMPKISGGIDLDIYEFREH